jgi:hypothetical protein
MSQFSITRDIYRQAQQVIDWLGMGPDKEANLALEIIQDLFRSPLNRRAPRGDGIALHDISKMACTESSNSASLLRACIGNAGSEAGFVKDVALGPVS